MTVIELDEDLYLAVAEATKVSREFFRPPVDCSTDKRYMGFAGEAAASIFLTGSDAAFRKTWQTLDETPDTPDLLDFPEIEVKTVLDLERPHFAIGNGFSQEVKATNYLVIRQLAIVRFQVEGWLPADQVTPLWKAAGEPRFPSGTPILPCSVLRSSMSCPWRRRDVATPEAG